ncbi:MAG: cation:proton antiporter [Eubacteriales bacterium]|nr:cation:proton antiporter [Eubacteriales bacterium]
MEYFTVLLPLAMILFLSKLFSIGCKKIGLPQVVGMLIVGILLGCIKYIPNQQVFTGTTLEGLSFIGKIGVILIMFSAGIGTDIKQIKATGKASIVITTLGVLVPLAFGFLVACAFNGGFKDWSNKTVLSNFFYGVILSATSVSVTVATLKELGKLQSKVGTSIVSAAIIDDVIGVVLLSLIIGLSKGNASDAGKSTGFVILYTVLFFVAAIGIGILIRLLFKWLEKKWPHNRRVAIWGFALCFFYAFAAEKWFGVADITGAYMAGLMLSGLKESNYIDRKADVNCYMIFAPVFFANIGINTDFSGMTGTVAAFGICYVLVAMLGKVIGCGAGALMCRYSFKDSMAVGVGMMVRAEVVLVCAQKGIDCGMIDPAIMPFVLILIIVSSLLAPLILKLFYKNEKVEPQFLDCTMPNVSENTALPNDSERIRVVTSENQLDHDFSEHAEESSQDEKED